MIFRRDLRHAALVAVWLANAACRLPACQICLPFPTMSAADHLIAADVVVFAREDPDKPFSLEAVEVLKGELVCSKIDLFLDTTSRRELADDVTLGLICTRRPPGGKEAGWQRIGTADKEFATLIREILARAADWRDDPAARIDYFMPLLGNHEDQVRTLAHLEVGRASYDRIRKLGTLLPVDEIRAFLDNVRYVEWHALYILLLAQSDDPQDQRRIEDAVSSHARFGMAAQLAAWITADIEVRQAAALDFVMHEYFAGSPRTPDEIKAVQLALSVQGNRGHVHLRNRIVDGYRVLLARHPQLAAEVVGDLFAWERWDLAEPVSRVLASPPPELDTAALAQLRGYLVQAKARTDGERPGGLLPDRPAGERLLWPALAALLVLAPTLAISGRGWRLRVAAVAPRADGDRPPGVLRSTSGRRSYNQEVGR